MEIENTNVFHVTAAKEDLGYDHAVGFRIPVPYLVKAIERSNDIFRCPIKNLVLYNRIAYRRKTGVYIFCITESYWKIRYKKKLLYYWKINLRCDRLRICSTE